MAKWVCQIEDARRIPELISQAFHTALNGRPGPVVIALPEDMLTDEVEVADAGPYKIARGAPSAQDMATLRALLEKAERPMVILGGGGWSSEACADIRAFIEANGLPVCASRSEEHTSELQSHRDLHSFPTRRSSDLSRAADGDPGRRRLELRGLRRHPRLHRGERASGLRL